MRILYDHQAFSLQTHGGITRVFSELVRYLNAQSTATTDVLLGLSSTTANFRKVISPPGRVIHLGTSPFSPGLLNYAVNDAISSLIGPTLGKYQVYHSTYYRFLPAIRAKYRVATHHDCGPEMFPQMYRNSRQIFRCKRELFRRADLIICVSEASRADLLRFYDVKPEKAVVVHNGISPMVRHPHGEMELHALLDGEFLLYVGSRSQYKNFDGLLRAFADSPIKRDYKLLVLGGGPPHRGHLKLVEELRLAGRVVFVPYASAALLAEAYSSAALLIYPSLYEGFGMPPLEAASLGCVSLVAANPATLEICRDAAFFFSPTDRQDLSAMLQVALGDTLGREDRVRVAKRLLDLYTWGECGRKTLDLYRRLL